MTNILGLQPDGPTGPLEMPRAVLARGVPTHRVESTALMNAAEGKNRS
jgi:hypothetical protein